MRVFQLCTTDVTERTILRIIKFGSGWVISDLRPMAKVTYRPTDGSKKFSIFSAQGHFNLSLRGAVLQRTPADYMVSG